MKSSLFNSIKWNQKKKYKYIILWWLHFVYNSTSGLRERARVYQNKIKVHASKHQPTRKKNCDFLSAKCYRKTNTPPKSIQKKPQMTRGYYPNLKQMPWKRVSERKMKKKTETTTKIIHRKPCFRGAWTHWKKRKDFFSLVRLPLSK